MHRLINTVATTAVVVVLMCGLWQDWNLLTSLKRMIIAYLAFFFLGSLMVLVIRIVPIFDKHKPAPAAPEGSKKRKKILG